MSSSLNIFAIDNSILFTAVGKIKQVSEKEFVSKDPDRRRERLSGFLLSSQIDHSKAKSCRIKINDKLKLNREKVYAMSTLTTYDSDAERLKPIAFDIKDKFSKSDLIEDNYKSEQFSNITGYKGIIINN